MATTRLISFRLTDAAITMLDHLREKNESINLAAQRLLTERLGLPAKATDTDAAASVLAVNNIVDKIVNTEYFRGAVLDQMASVINGVNGKNAEIEQTVKQLGEAVQQLSARVNSLSPIGDTYPSESTVVDDETDDGQDIPTGAVGELLEPTDILTSEAESDPAVMGLTDSDDAVTETDTTVEDAIAAEEPQPLTLDVEGLAERFKLKEATIQSKAEKLTPDAFAKYYDKKDPDYYWYPQKDKPVLEFVAVKKDDAQTVEQLQKPKQLALIGATA